MGGKQQQNREHPAPFDVLVEQGLPCNPEAERIVLGCILLQNAAWDLASQSLNAEDFSVHSNRLIWRAMGELKNAGSPIDEGLLIGRMTGTKQWQHIVGGVSYLSDLTTDARPANVLAHARVVRDKAILRRTIRAAANIVQSGLDGDSEDVESFLRRSEQSIMEATRQNVSEGAVHISEVCGSLNRVLDGGKRSAVPTGFQSLDDKLCCGGFPTKELNFLMGRSGHGKTALMLNMAEGGARAGYHQVVFSLETSKERILLRLCCQRAKVSVYRALHGWMGKEELRKISEAESEISKLPIFVNDSAGLTAQDIGSHCRRLKVDHPSAKGWQVWIDFLQLMKPGGNRRNSTTNDDIKRICNELKDLAKEIDSPVNALLQLKRPPDGKEDGPPELSDIRDSGEPEIQGYTILGVFREDRAKQNKEGQIKTNQADVFIRKDKDGPCGKVRLGFEGEHTCFVDLEETGQGNL